MSGKIVWIFCTVLVFVFVTLAFGSFHLYFAGIFPGVWTTLLDALLVGAGVLLFIRVVWTAVRIWRDKK